MGLQSRQLMVLMDGLSDAEGRRGIVWGRLVDSSRMELGNVLR